jgi:hypothetical protein
VVTYDGLKLVAERPAGRRNRIGTVLVSAADSADTDADEEARADAATQIAEEARIS